MEETSCPMCDHDDPRELLTGRDLLHPGPEQFRMVVCRRCGHIYQNPRPSLETIGRYYPDDYISYQQAIEDDPNWWSRLQRRYGERVRCLPLHRAAGRPGRLLDIGCATGLFLAGMRRLGWQTQGIEPSPMAAAYARERLGLDVITGRLEETNFPDASFDAISMWDVLEHVHEPRPVLAELARILRPGGLLLLSMPNPDSLEAHYFGRHWLGWDLPRHLNLYRPTMLRAYLARYGMPVEQIRSFTAGHSVMVMSLELKLKAAGLDGRRIARLLMSTPVRLLTKPYYAGPANWYNLSSTMVVFARRLGTQNQT